VICDDCIAIKADEVVVLRVHRRSANPLLAVDAAKCGRRALKCAGRHRHSKSNNATHAGPMPAMATAMTAVAAFSASRCIARRSVRQFGVDNAISTSSVAIVPVTAITGREVRVILIKRKRSGCRDHSWRLANRLNRADEGGDANLKPSTSAGARPAISEPTLPRTRHQKWPLETGASEWRFHRQIRHTEAPPYERNATFSV
jgi:hypothetical protein